MHPALFMVAGLEIPYGKNEYDVAGGLIGGLFGGQQQLPHAAGCGRG